jgi:translocation and assembly module TamB
LRRGELGKAPARARLVADRLNLAFLPAAAPGTVRSAGGELGADIVASGPLARMRPQGTLRIAEGRMAIASIGEWSGVEVDASLSEDVLKVSRLEAHRGGGRLDAKAEATGLTLREGPGKFTAELRTRGLTIPKDGQDLVTLQDVDATASGTFDAEALRAEVRVPRAEVRLPERPPRALQPLGEREDIVIGVPRRRGREPGEEPPAGGEERPYRLLVHTVVPNRFFVKSDNPRIDLELRSDATYDVTGADVFAEGNVEVIRGEVEPIGGRRFVVERGRVTFTGGEPADAILDVVARYEAKDVKVFVTIAGSTKSPQIKMTSEPPMDEAQIAMFIATGRTELKAGGGGVGGSLTGEAAGMAALGAVATKVFKDLVADKLPLDTVAIESGQTEEGTASMRVRAGKYVSDKMYVGYTFEPEAKLEEGENRSELRFEYQLTPRWTFESRYGDGNAGGASLIWSKDY